VCTPPTSACRRTNAAYGPTQVVCWATPALRRCASGYRGPTSTVCGPACNVCGPPWRLLSPRFLTLRTYVAVLRAHLPVGGTPFRGVWPTNQAVPHSHITGRYEMPRFPRSEPEIAALALVVTQGLTQASDDFPTPPVAVDELQVRQRQLGAGRHVGRNRAHAEQSAARCRVGVSGVRGQPRWEWQAERYHHRGVVRRTTAKTAARPVVAEATGTRSSPWRQSVCRAAA